ncbi:protein YrbN [Pectobacterium brasiliense]|uniref:Protein YrbN n=12 Tax=Pectobacterium TaxID=122277 RepID=A0A7V8PDS0_9GAMM|nr:protein YrbN [Pectobacterium brasiliense]AZK64924.1 protein YrbN [Pectobacterium versatile]KAA3668969.1 protein YrbN [Pectobacterium carotovorum subsp. carotovorum]MBA0177258.1 protein YrbN [Pectobacterium carotovorum]MBA0187013.1 protein YrbN [Pectobacterium odoriferum]MBE5203432.1 protein YrbN [Pectobacterium quasiaquaticum]MBN3063489.1 protein YrbN [Pectobacterium aquaticum]MBN3081882.1 protein YrbN [Pectobacterium polaris]MBN3136021.1 protein YrbN [Pectobacterium punjabense]MCL63750
MKMTENFHDELCRLAAMFNEARVHD